MNRMVVRKESTLTPVVINFGVQFYKPFKVSKDERISSLPVLTDPCACQKAQQNRSTSRFGWWVWDITWVSLIESSLVWDRLAKWSVSDILSFIALQIIKSQKRVCSLMWSELWNQLVLTHYHLLPDNTLCTQVRKLMTEFLLMIGRGYLFGQFQQLFRKKFRPLKSPDSEGDETFDLIKRMAEDLNVENLSGSMTCAPEVLAKTWTKDMIWYGPCGIGASMTIPRYQRQHQLPFRFSY